LADNVSQHERRRPNAANPSLYRSPVTSKPDALSAIAAVRRARPPRPSLASR
jgi:hypothetical protein